MSDGTSRWAGIELRHLAALTAIARTGSFHGAAERLGFTQSSVSEQIAGLERVVGERLIYRPGGPRRVSLTAAGQLLLRHAELILTQLQAAETDLHAFALGESGSLTVGTYQSVSRQILPPLMRHFSSCYPKVEVALTESADDADFFPLIERGDLDLAFAIYPLPPGPFEDVELLRDPYVLVVPVTSSLASREALPTLREIGTLQLIGFREQRSVAPIEAHLRARGIEPRIVFRSDDSGTVEALVASGLGTALVPRLTVTRGDPRVTVLELDDDLPARRVALIWRRDRHRSPVARAFVAAAERVCRDVASDFEGAARARQAGSPGASP